MNFCKPIFIVVLAVSLVSFSKPKKRLPIRINSAQNIDSISTFIKAYLQSKKMQVISLEDAIKIQEEKITAAILDYKNKNKDLTAQDIFKVGYHLPPALNTINYWFVADSITQSVDSIYWNINYLPFQFERQPIKHRFVPHNKSVYHALKEMCDSIIASKHVL